MVHLDVPREAIGFRTDILEVRANEDETSVSVGVDLVGSGSDRVPDPYLQGSEDAHRRRGDGRDA